MSHEDNEQHADNVPINRTVISMPKKQEVSTQWAYCVSFSLPLKLLQWSRQSLKYRQESSITACLLVQIEKLVGLFVWYDLPSFCQLETCFPPCLGWKRRQKQTDINQPTQKKSFLTLLLKWGLDSCSHILRGFRVWETGSLFFARSGLWEWCVSPQKKLLSCSRCLHYSCIPLQLYDLREEMKLKPSNPTFL